MTNRFDFRETSVNVGRIANAPLPIRLTAASTMQSAVAVVSVGLAEEVLIRKPLSFSDLPNSNGIGLVMVNARWLNRMR